MSRVEENIKLVHFIVHKYFGTSSGYAKNGFSHDDLFQIGCVGLIHADRKFDESLGFAFSTFATKLIVFEIKKELTDKFIMIKYPREVKRIARIIGRLEKKYSVEDIMEEFEVTEDISKLVLECNSFYMDSLDKPLFENKEESDIMLADVIASDYSLEDTIIDDLELQERLSILDDRERKIILLALKKVNQKEIGKQFGITQVQVSRLIKKSIEKINKHFNEIGGVLT